MTYIKIETIIIINFKQREYVKTGTLFIQMDVEKLISENNWRRFCITDMKEKKDITLIILSIVVIFLVLMGLYALSSNITKKETSFEEKNLFLFMWFSCWIKMPLALKLAYLP